jgi:hypothetical protein
MDKNIRKSIPAAAKMTGVAALTIFLTAMLAGCGESQEAKTALKDKPAAGLQLSVKFSAVQKKAETVKGVVSCKDGDPGGDAPGSLIAALKAPKKANPKAVDRWAPAIMLCAGQSVAIEAKSGATDLKVKVEFLGEAECCDTKAVGEKGLGVGIIAPDWTGEMMNRAYPFKLFVDQNQDGVINEADELDPVIIPK